MDEHTAPTPPADQPTLPLGPVPERPIPFALTARARRAVAPQALPELSVVAPADGRTGRSRGPHPDGGLPDGAAELPGDTRPARARALRRSGLGVAAIARRLGVEPLLVQTWVGERPTLLAELPTAELVPDEVGDHRRQLEAVRAAASAEALQARTSDPVLAGGLGLLAGTASVDAYATTLTGTRPELLAAVLRWLVATAGVAVTEVRVVLRVGPGTAADLVRHRWAVDLGLEPWQVVHTRWPGAPFPDAVEARIRCPGDELAARVAGWCEGFLAPADDPADVAF